MRRQLMSWVLAASTLGASTAVAQGEPACVPAFDAAQEHQEAGALLRAREQLASCSSTACPTAIRAKCVTWLEEVDAAIPTIVVAAREGSDRDITDVTITIDGVTLAGTLDGRSIALDPGPHILQFTRAGADTIEERIVAVVGVKNRLVTVTFPAPTPPPTPPPLPPPPVAPPMLVPAPIVRPTPQQVSPFAYVGFAVGGTGLLVGAVTAAIAYDKFPETEALCASPEGCSDADIAEGETLSHVATAGFIVGGAGVAAGVIALLLTWPDGGTTAAGVTPIIGVGLVGMRGRF